jgi:hypothetical protein
MNSLQSTVNWLSYKSYEHQRLRRPDIPYFKWRKIYADAIVFEEIFDQNIKTIHNQGAWGHDNDNNI